MARGIGTFILIILAGIVGVIIGGLFDTVGVDIFLGILFSVATAGGLITYYQASDKEDPQKKQ